MKTESRGLWNVWSAALRHRVWKEIVGFVSPLVFQGWVQPADSRGETHKVQRTCFYCRKSLSSYTYCSSVCVPNRWRERGSLRLRPKKRLGLYNNLRTFQEPPVLSSSGRFGWINPFWFKGDAHELQPEMFQEGIQPEDNYLTCCTSAKRWYSFIHSVYITTLCRQHPVSKSPHTPWQNVSSLYALQKPLCQYKCMVS